MPTFDTPIPISATIDVIAGDIRVIAADRTDTVVEVHPRDESHNLDVKTAAQTRVDYADGKLTVKTPKPLQVFFSARSATVDVTVSLPAGSHVRATTTHGDLTCEGRLGDCTLRTYDGDVSLHRADQVRLTTLHGRITVDRVDRDAHITGSGEVRLAQVGGAANLKNLDGPSWIGQVDGEVHVNSAHGDITIDRAGPRVVARTAHGSVSLREVATGEAVLQTASGDIEVGILPGSSAWLEVKSSYGRVRNELDATDEPDGPSRPSRSRSAAARWTATS